MSGKNLLIYYNVNSCDYWKSRNKKGRSGLFVEYLKFTLGILMLVYGAELFVRKSSELAENLRVSSLIVGLIGGGIGTSLPEIAVSWTASFKGNHAISIGNAVGSNAANTAVVLGIGALLSVIYVDEAIIKKDYRVLLFSSLVFFVFSINGFISRPEGGIMVALGVGYLYSLIKRKGKENGGNRGPVGLNLLASIVGVALLLVGAEFIINSAVGFAETFGLSEAVVGLSVVAAGTSLPELSVVIAGGLCGKPRISLGTVIGSNIFNILFVAGGAAFIRATFFTRGEVLFYGPTLVLLSLILLPVIVTSKMISRWEGGGLIVVFCVYLYLVFVFL